MVKVVINDSKGLVQSAGSGFEVEQTNLSVGGLAGAGALAGTAAPDSPAQGETGAVSIATTRTLLETDADNDAWTLADGTATGQLKSIRLETDGGGDMVVTPSNLADGSTITFDTAGDEVLLVWDGSNWRVLLNSGCAVA